MFSTPQVNIYSEDVVRSVEFYRGFGFEETFRTPRDGDPIHVELELDGFKVGIAALTSAVADHGLVLDLSKPGRGMEILLWTDNTDAAFGRLKAAGARVLSEPHDWLGTLRVAWVADPDDNPIELAQRLP
jgi:catechol 2,3-dioxygenase-like lactoylglutathione lyase family enzyme